VIFFLLKYLDISEKNIIFVIDNIKNNYYFIAIRGVLRSRLYKMNEIERFLSNNLRMSEKSSTFASSKKKQEV
jgi:hypothetical protein